MEINIALTHFRLQNYVKCRLIHISPSITDATKLADLLDTKEFLEESF
jgi:hypothetical protein